MPEIRNTIRLTNSMTRRKEVFEPLDPGHVRMYVCGPTVYDRAHLGNARPVVVFDVLYRLLRHVYGADHITYVRNITDVDDKIIDRARESGIPIDELTATTGAWFRDDMAALGALPPTHEPHATLHVDGMVAMISELVASGHAYVAGHHVLFSVASDPTYGRLSGRSTEDMIAGARVEIAPYKRDPMDFVLWKPSTEGQPGWPSPWGRGRPGWHIECSAMARQLLGPEFDIHGGGTDLLFPHHENEIAQSTSTGDRFARVWLHNEMLQVEGKKMSKSLGNFFTVRDLLDQGIPGEVIRLVFLMTHYRSPMDWTDRRAREAKVELANWYRLTFDSDVGECSELVIQALADDMNTHAAITECRSLYGRKDARTLKVSARLMGLLEDESAGWWRPPIVATMSAHEAGSDTFSGAAQVKVGPEGFVWELLRQRAEARSSRDFALADEIRDSLVAAGVVIMDRPDGPTEWRPGPDFDPAKLESLR